MKITEIQTYLVYAGAGSRSGSWSNRNWLFVKVLTDEGIYGVGEGSGWPLVIQSAINDMAHVLIGEDPMHIEKLWQKMLLATMGHGMTGVVGSGAMNAIDMALYDIKGKVLNTPVWNLLGGKIRDRIWAYPHASTPERARQLVDRGFTAIKAGGVTGVVSSVAAIRQEVGSDVDLMVDAHGPPWLTTADAIRLGKELEQFDLLFYEDPVAPENIEALAQVKDAVDLPIAAGERHSHIWGARQLIEREIVDVIQPDTGRAGGLTQLKKIAALAEAHYIGFAPHSGSLGPIAEFACLHLLATLPNFLIMEHLEDDCPQRYEVIDNRPEIIHGEIVVPDAPGLGVDIVEDAIAHYPSHGNVSAPSPDEEYVYYRARRGRASWAKS